jgi:hypothetical protein
VKSCDCVSAATMEMGNRVVCGRTSPLNEDLLLAAKSNDVPNDHEVAGEVQLFNQRQFPLYLPLGTFEQFLVAFHHIAVLESFFGPLSGKR